MDLIKVGAFIADKRKEKGLTQIEVAKKLYLTDRAVSKWERGKSLPDVAVMQSLCEMLGVTLNELLSGECMVSEEKEKKAENVAIELLREREDYARKSWVTLVIAIAGVFVFVSSLLLMGYFIANNAPLWITILTPALGTAVADALIVVVFILDRVRGFFECQKCKHRFVPRMGDYIKGKQKITSRKLKCPNCNESTWCKHKKTSR
ncbi:MAG: helix-turn-helix domain-containing protein [Firmicutes bacterium]|nr:helix-turn-helix domain-containing protein [Bacillota bacterium]MCL2255744.1 helix-turn-helix domain-containing protein [Bacillota bacterium]